ncbi:hypothetical protein V6N13_108400 [Hibiscus sabdariffa]
MSGSPIVARESAMTKGVVNPSGRPPDALPSRLNSVDLLDSNNPAMEADEEIPHVGVEPGVALPGEAVKDSYSNKVLGKQSKDGANHCFLKDEVLIRVEDIIKDYSCGGDITKSDYVVEGQKSIGTVSGVVETEVSESNRFGPWMIVADKRQKGGYTRVGFTPTNNAVSGSRFAALAIEESDPIHVDAQDKEDNEGADNSVRGKQVVVRNIGQKRMVSTNVAYKSSNLDKKKKSSKSMPPVMAVPGGNGETVQATEHIPGILQGEHRVVRINENGQDGDAGGRGSAQRRNMILGSGRRESSHRSFQVRCGNGARVSNHVSASEFVNRITSELHSIGKSDKANSSCGPTVHGATSPMIQSSNDEDFYRSNSPEILPKGALFADNQ